MPVVAVVSNPRSGRNRRKPEEAERLKAVLGESGLWVEPQTLDSLHDAVRDFRAHGVDVVCVNGGDGTLHKVLSAMVVVYGEGMRGPGLQEVDLPHVVTLKGGTLNTMASNLGQKAGGVALLKRVVDAFSGDVARPAMKVVQRTLMVANGRHAGFLFGTGVLYRFMKMYEEGSPPGPWKALGLVAQVCGSTAVGGGLAQRVFSLDEASVVLDGAPWAPRAFASIAVGTMDDIGLGFRMFHAASANPGKMHILGFHCPPMSVLKRLYRIPLGKPLCRPDIIDTLGQKLVISGEAAQGFMMDGDFVDGLDGIELEAGPTVRFLVD